MCQMHRMEVQSTQMGEQRDLDQRAVKIENGVIQRKQPWPDTKRPTNEVGWLSFTSVVACCFSSEAEAEARPLKGKAPLFCSSQASLL